MLMPPMLMVGVVLLFSGVDPEPAITAPPIVLTKERAERLLRMGAPGAEHARLTDRAGRWRVELELVDPAGATVRAEGSATIDSIMGGRYSRIAARIDPPTGAASGAYDFTIIDGYSNERGIYQNVTIDSGSEQMTRGEGRWDGTGIVWMPEGLPEDAATSRSVTTFLSADAFLQRMETRERAGEAWKPVATLTFTREK